MSTIKTKFTLHKNHKDFALGVSSVEAKSLIPYSAQEVAASRLILPLLIFCGFMFILSIERLYVKAVVPFLFQNFSQTTTAQVIDCEMQETKQYGYIPYLTYAYMWSNQPFTDRERIYGYDMDSCESFLNQAIAIRVLISDPGQTSLIVAETSHPISEDLFMIGAFLGMGVFGGFGVFLFLYLIALQIRAEITCARLTIHSTLLEGQIISIRGHTHDKSKEYLVSITYAFETPHKRRLTGWAEARRDDLRDTPLPPIGTPVAVLYADDHAHMML